MIERKVSSVRIPVSISDFNNRWNREVLDLAWAERERLQRETERVKGNYPLGSSEGSPEAGIKY